MNRSTTNPVGGPKQPYVKPSFEYEKVFETMALQCGKIGNSSNNCKLVRKTS